MQAELRCRREGRRRDAQQRHLVPNSGLLTITLPKSEQAAQKTKRIEIKH
jgi:HSP20 family molecular chaperone IbpA